METETVLFCMHDEESQVSGIEDGVAQAFDRVVAVWGSSGASTGRACLGRSVRGSGEGRGGEG